MTPQEHLLVSLMEESAEIAQVANRITHAAAKALRFGLDDGYPGTDRTNRTDLVREVNDLLGVLEALQEAGVELPGLFDRQMIETKKSRIKRWMDYAREQESFGEEEP
jgi:hypothetical protein